MNAIQSRYKPQYGDNDNLMNGGDNYGELVSSISDTESSIGHNPFHPTYLSMSNNEHSNMESDIDNRNRDVTLLPLPSCEIPMSSAIALDDKSREQQHQQQVEQPLVLDQEMDYSMTNDDQKNLLNGDEENLAQRKPSQVALPQIKKYPESRNQHYRYHHQHYNHHYQQQQMHQQQRHQQQAQLQHSENSRKTVRNKVLSKSIRRKMKRMRHDLRQPDIFGAKGESIF